MTRRSTLLYCLHALLVASAGFAYWMCSVATDPNAPPRYVLVAKKNLSMGTKIDNPEECFDLVPAFCGEGAAAIPKGVVRIYIAGKFTIAPNSALNSFDQVRGKELKRSIKQASCITRDDFFESVPFVWPIQAAGVRINATESEAMSLCGQHVDIWCRSRSGYRMCVEQVLVLEVDRQLCANNDRTPVPSMMITLEMTPENVLRMELAKTTGVIVLKIGDQEIGTPHMTERRQLDTPDLRQSVAGSSGQSSLR